MTIKIEDMFGDLKKIDILAEKSETNEVLMVLVCNGFIDGSPQTQKALLDKMEDTSITHKVKYSKKNMQLGLSFYV